MENVLLTTQLKKVFKISSAIKRAFYFCVLFIGIKSTTAQVLIAGWDFQTTTTGGTALLAAPNTPSVINANIGTGTIYLNGTNGSSTWASTASSPELTSFGGSSLNVPLGLSNVTTGTSALAIANTTANGKNIIFSIDMTGKSDLIISYATRGTSTGFSTHLWEYSTNGIAWSPIISQAANITSTYTVITIPTVTGLNNIATAFVRLTPSGSTNATGNNRLDNIQFNATASVAAPPVISSPLTSTATFNTAFTYSIVASNIPTSYTATGLPTGLTLNTSTGVITGLPATGTASAIPYAVTIEANNASGTDTKTLNLTVDKLAQTITGLPATDSKLATDPSYVLNATTTLSPISYNSNTPTVAGIAGNIVSIVSVGITTITATQAGDADYLPATATQILTVNQAPNTISFGALANAITTDPSINLGLNSSAGLPIVYTSSNPSIADVVGNVLSYFSVGTVTITASQAGNANYLPATNVLQTLTVNSAALTPQTITFSLPSPSIYGDVVLLNGSASSGLTVSYSSSDNSIGAITGNTLTAIAIGTITVTATQAGNTTFASASAVLQTLVINVKPLTISNAMASNKSYDGTTVASISGQTVVGVVGSDAVTLSAANANFSTANVGMGIPVTTNFTITGADIAKYSLSQPSGLTADITQATQLITFAPLPTLTTATTTYTLLATATSGLPITYSSNMSSVASIVGNIVTVVGVGTTTITANQLGDANVAAALPVDQILTITASPVLYSFGTTTGIATPTSGLPITNLSFSAVTPGNSTNTSQVGLQLTTTSASSSYAGASGAMNAGITAENATFSSTASAYFEFAITPSAGFQTDLSGFTFGSRSTSTGPTEFTIKTNIDGFASAITTLAGLANSTYSLHTVSFSPTITNGTNPLIIRIYGAVPSGSGSVGAASAINWRIDDLSPNAIASASACVTPILSSTIIDNLCFGDATASIDLIATGGSLPITYVWSNAATSEDISGLVNGVYTVTATANGGCTTFATVTIVSPALLLNGPSIISPCVGGVADVTLATFGGTAPYNTTPSTTGLVTGTYTFVTTDFNGCSTSIIETVSCFNGTLSATASPILCNIGFGTVTATSTGFTGTVNYTLQSNTNTSGNFVNVPAGIYTVNATDGVNSLSTIVIVNPGPSALIVSASASAILCNGGTTNAVVAAIGGTGSISIMPSAVNLVAGNYTFTATDLNGCSASTSIFITQPNAISIAPLANQIACSGGSGQISYTTIGGTLPIDVTINSVATTSPIINLAPNTYTLEASDVNGCTVAQVIVINAAPPALAISLSSNSILCNGGTALVTAQANGGTPYAGSPAMYVYGSSSVTPIATYTANLGASPVSGYTIVATDFNGCTVTGTILITQPSAILFTTTAIQPICSNSTGSVNLVTSGGTGAITTMPVSASLVAGVYTFTASDVNSCTVSATVIIVAPAAISTILTLSGSPFVLLPWSSVPVTVSGTYTNMYIANNGCDSLVTANVTITTAAGIVVCAKVFLTGPFDKLTGLMNDSLRTKGLIPTTTPYGNTPYINGFTNVSNPGGEIIGTGVLSVTGNNAIVDWVFVQLRSKTNSSIVVATRSALIQRDGDIVDASDGVSPVSFANIVADDYFVSVKHRVHLGVMTANVFALSNTPNCINFTSLSTNLFVKTGVLGNPSPLSGPTRIEVSPSGNVRTLYSGNCNISSLATTKYINYNNATTSDRTALFTATGGVSTIIGYSIFDLDMNGFARFNGLSPDRLVILTNCANVATAVIFEQLP